MKKTVHFLIVTSFLCLNGASYADKYGEFMELAKASVPKACLKIFAEALRETEQMLELTAKDNHEHCISNCFGLGNDVTNAFPAYVFRFRKLKRYYNDNNLNKSTEESPFPLNEAVLRCQQLIEKSKN